MRMRLNLNILKLLVNAGSYFFPDPAEICRESTSSTFLITRTTDSSSHTSFEPTIEAVQKEWDDVKAERDSLVYEKLAPLWAAAYERPKQQASDFDLLEKLIAYSTPINMKYSLAREKLRNVTLDTENEIHRLENELKYLIVEHEDIQVEPIAKEPLLVGYHHLFNPVTKDEARELSLRLKTVQGKYSQAVAQLAVIHTEQTSPILQINAASHIRITPLAALFQFMQYGRDFLSNSEIQHLIVSSITNATAMAITTKISIFSQNAAAAHALQESDNYTNRIGF
jgi:hypothetical protein